EFGNEGNAMSAELLSSNRITVADACAFARQHGLEKWFDAHVINPRMRMYASPPPSLEPGEIDLFVRLQLLVMRAREAFDDEDEGISWLTRPCRIYDGLPPIEYARWENGLLCVLDQLN